MFVRRVRIERVNQTVDGLKQLVPLAWLDSFAMRNFTSDAIFDDTLPVADGILEVGNRVPVATLADAMQAWFRRKGWLGESEYIQAMCIEPETHSMSPAGDA